MAKQDFSAALNLAESLAAFANLKPEGIADFRSSHSNFAPDSWWYADKPSASDPVSPLCPSWREGQQLVRQAWQAGFPPQDCIDLVVAGSNINFMDQNFQSRSDAINMMSEQESAEYFSNPLNYIKPRQYDFQLAVMFLFAQPWRAGICSGAPGHPCGKFFVKTAPINKACSAECKNARISFNKLDWWRKDGKKQRVQKSKAKKGRKNK